MTVKGRVKGRSIELAEPLPELDGQEVLVSVNAVIRSNGHDTAEAPVQASKGSSILDRATGLLAGIPEEELARLPVDLAEQHDHYLYGTPKRHE